jgi:hypothetical protein
VPKTDAASIDIHLIAIQPELFFASKILRRKCFMHLNHIVIINLAASLLEQIFD